MNVKYSNRKKYKEDIIQVLKIFYCWFVVTIKIFLLIYNVDDDETAGSSCLI